MDEFDNALDAENRGAIAQMIVDLSKTSQFLITTFKPELVEGANKLYQVSTRNHVSSMLEIDSERAHKLINDRRVEPPKSVGKKK